MLSPPEFMFSITCLGLYGFFRGMDMADLAVEVIERSEAGIALLPWPGTFRSCWAFSDPWNS